MFQNLPKRTVAPILDQIPSASQYVNLTTDTYWKNVSTSTNQGDFDPTLAQPGDILAWASDGGGDTGHVMVVVDTPTTSGGITPITVIDASDLTHLNDSRNGLDGTGVGQGTITLKKVTQGTGTAATVYWNVNFDTSTKSTDTYRPLENLSLIRIIPSGSGSC